MSAVRNLLVAAVVLVLLVVFGACSAEIADIAETTAVPETTAAVSTETPVGTVAPDVAGLAAGDHTVSLAHGGRDRSYIVHVPAGVTVPAPVVVALHGGGGTGEGFQDENNLDAVADAEGFVAVYPEGTGILADRLHTWNAGGECCGYAHDNNIDDVGFLRAVIDDLQVKVSVDPSRIYMTGHSNGARMAYRFAAEASELVAAIVPVAGAPDVEPAVGALPVPVLHIHSVDDPRALYAGGEGPPFPGTNRTIVHAPVMESIESWATVQNRCEAGPDMGPVVEAAAPNDGQTTTLLQWNGCADGAPFDHLRLTGSGHGWPGVTVGRLWQNLLGPPTTVIDASAEVWAFVSEFSR